MSVTAYTAAYVRELAANRRLRARVSACLANGLAWEQEERLVVCMIDISGYSKLSAGLTVLGKMESEIITKTVGGYLNKIIDVIEVYSGDIVRFLGGYFTLVTASVESHDRVGDALLVTFTPVNDEFLGEAVLRSLKCCLHVATCCKSVDVDMSLASTSTATTSGDYTSTKVAGPSASLHLHFAITAGNMSRVIIGDPAWRLDYCIQGSGLRSLGVLLDNTGKGELGISSDAVEELPDKWRGAVESMKAGIVAGHSLLNAIAVASLAGICCNVGATALADMSVGQASSLFKAAYAAVCTRRGSDVGFDEDETDDDFVRLFVNHSSLRRFDGLTGIRRATVISNGLQGSQADVVVGRRASVIAKGAQGAQADVSAGRRASVSFIRRGSVMSYSQDAGNPATAAEFRNVATIFVSLMFPFEKDLVQTIMLSFLKALKEHKGVFVQYSADDKGQTMLAVFGLPSFSHVNNSDQSIKCVKFFIEDIKRTLGGSLFAKHLAIAIASGEILLTKLGNDYRSEIGLLGDVIVAAARLMSIAQKKEAVIIDEETNHKIKLTHPTADLGLVHLKGRTGDTQVYGLQLEGIEARGPGAGLGRFGYRHEREVIGERFSAWISDRRRTLVVIEAASGLGKSMLGNFLTGLATDHGIPVCLTQGSEIEQWRPFSGLQPILMFVLNNIPSTPRHPGAVSAVTMMKNSTSKIIRSQSFSTYSGRHSDTGLSLNGAPGSGLAGHVIPFLEKAGIDIRLMPLLGMISPSLAATETALTRSMDPLAKINHVKSMVAKIVTTFVLDFAAIFIFDDAQWFDSHTLEVLMTLSRHCPKSFIQIQSRPLELSENRILDQTLALADTAHLILKGFTEQEATEMIMSKLSKLTVRVKGIDSNISTAILAKTAGSPLFLQMIIDVIFVKIGGELVVNDDGVVVLRDDSVRIETILTDLGAAVLFQFDRLDEVFQRLLKTASVFGQYFNLRNVLDLGDFDMDEMECIDMIKERDTYNFLSYDLPTPASSQELDTESRSSSDGVQCSFRHISILNAIYESLSFEERIAMNLSVGLMVEGLLNEGNRENLLPSLEYHFARTQEVEKVIKYKEELGFSLMAKYECVEGIRILESLVQYVGDASREALTRMIDPITPLRRAWWHTRLCRGLGLLKRYPRDIEAGKLALSYLPTTPWPKNEKELTRALLFMKKRTYVNWFLTAGGRRGQRKSRRRVSPEDQHGNEIDCEKAVLWSMTETAGLNKARSNDEVCYLLLRYFNLRMLHNDDELEWGDVLFKLSWYSLFLAPAYQRFFVKRAEAVDNGRDHPAYIFMKGASKCFARDFMQCIPLMLKFFEIAKNRGDSASEHLAMVFVGGNSFSLGDFDYIDDTTVTFFKTSPTMKDDPIFSFTMAALIYKVALMRGDAQAMAEWREVFEPRERVASMLNFGLGMKEVLEAWVAAIKADVSTALDLLEKCDKIMPRRDMAAQDMAVMQALPFVFILIVDPMRSGVSTNSHTSKWQGAELKRLKDVVASATAYTRYLGTVMHHCFSYWTMPLMESIGQILHGHERRAVHIASKTIKCIRRKELDEQKLVKAIYCGIIAKYSSSETERSRSKSFARDEFSRVKSPLYLNWLDA